MVMVKTAMRFNQINKWNKLGHNHILMYLFIRIRNNLK